MNNFLRSLTQQPAHAERHYFFIDLLRGMAAIGVLFIHYKFFFGPRSGAEFAFAAEDQQPLYSIFRLLYTDGYYAVELFWVISGFVLSAVYIGKRPSARSFFVNRFSRLYPLHFITLVAIAVVQSWSRLELGHFQITQHNDSYRFVLNLLFVSGWGFVSDPSFNFPTWSVSVEIVSYCIFFLLLPVLFRRGLLGPSIALLLFLGLRHLEPQLFPLLNCGMYFFVGSCVFVFLKTFRAAAVPVGIALIAVPVALAFGLHTKIVLAQRLVPLFAGTVLILGYFDETVDLTLVKSKLQWIGENTYSLYLLALPVQFALMTALDLANIDRVSLASTTWFFALYMVSLFLFARLSFLYIERPLQAMLRERLLPRPRSVPQLARL